MCLLRSEADATSAVAERKQTLQSGCLLGCRGRVHQAIYRFANAALN